ncbi:MAG TPA: carboxy terminal-processing peptidase [Polyangiaceae bacterium]|nr:carboxy terminal-processing peptidase [Polyangiaceae bacterium]
MRFLATLLLAAGTLVACSPPRPTPATKSNGSAAAGVATAELAEVPADPREPVLAQAAVALLTKQHVLRRPIDDAMSREAFPKFVEELDGAKLFLLQGHVDALARYADGMDDELAAGDLALARKGAALIAARRASVAGVVKELLSKPFDFAAPEALETDPKKRAHCRTEAELRDRWRGVLKLQALERLRQLEESLEARGKPKPPPKDPDEARREAIAERALGDIPPTFEGREEKVRRDIAARYETQFARLAAPEKLAPAEDFLNAVNAVFDPHTQYLAPAQEANFDIAMTGTLEGIGATLAEQDHYVAVVDLVPGGASWQQGRLEIGDLILAVAQEGKEAVQVVDMPIDKVVAMIRGPKGTVVVLTVKKGDGRVETISITRDVIRIEATYARGAVLRAGGAEPVGYVFLPGFYGDIGPRAKPGERNATDDVRAILDALQKRKVRSLVLDLRGNGGGLLAHARDISGLFLDRGPVVQTKDAAGRVEVLRDEAPGATFDGDVVVLVDRFSASAAEILAGALQDYERAVVVGTSATHGKGTVQAVFDLDRLGASPGGEPLGLYKVTVEEYFRVSGASTQLRGVTPDILLPDPTSFVDSGERTLFHAIPFHAIGAAPFAKVPHRWQLADLQRASRERTGKNADFETVRAFGALLTARREKTLENLELATWQAAKKREKAEIERVDPKKIDRKPLLTVEVLPGASTATADKKLRQRLDAWQNDLARDLWVDESVRVLADMAPKR